MTLIEQLRRGVDTNEPPDKTDRIMTEAADEIDRLQELLRGTGANRYWEGRWRDTDAENQKLRAALEESLSSPRKEGK